MRYFTRLPTVKYVGLHWPRLPNSLPAWRPRVVGQLEHLDVVAEAAERALDEEVVRQRSGRR